MKISPYYLKEGIHQVNGTSYLGRILSLEVMFDLQAKDPSPLFSAAFPSCFCFCLPSRTSHPRRQ